MARFKPLATVLVLAIAATAVPARAEVASGAAPPPARPHHVYLIGALRISQPWIDVGGDAPDRGSAYLVVENRSNVPDRLTGASLTGAAAVSLADAAGGASGPEGLVVPPNGTLTLKPGDAHLALRGLQGVVAKGPPVDGTVRFERSGSLHLSFLTDQGQAINDDASEPSAKKPVDLAQ